ncbi:TIGR04338 family metallohydrolase [Gordonia sp. HY002]|uniref:TIGR04338 family metallohydrolase n=1 Tax=Gordonia zhenghanii TaxID=2911516 RepID=UPI001F2AC93C|nr:TIGR04338 family metallohydrolase [Gordonia zhenghanii]MCF8570103.1 TIGR04338 family metallohydrolase [Gordonia zhenghanii]
MTRDSNRSAVYDAERLVHRIFERAGSTRTVQIAGTDLTVPPEAKFSSVESVRRYVDDVLAAPAVRARFPRAAHPVAVRRRRGSRAAHYERDGAVIAVPDSADGAWALRELVVLHEVAHHVDDVGSPAHGRCFVDALIDLVGLVLGPETAFVYRVVFGDSGLL